MTDGDGQYNEIQKHLEEENFVNVRKTLQMFQCFCIGYGPRCAFDALQNISKVINENKTYKFVEGKRIDYVQSAASSNLVETLREIAKTLNFEESALRRTILSMDNEIKSL